MKGRSGLGPSRIIKWMLKSTSLCVKRPSFCAYTWKISKPVRDSHLWGHIWNMATLLGTKFNFSIISPQWCVYHGVLAYQVHQIGTHNILQPMERKGRKVKRPGTMNLPGQVSGWMGGGREVGEKNRSEGRDRGRKNKTRSFLKKPKAYMWITDSLCCTTEIGTTL